MHISPRTINVKSVKIAALLKLGDCNFLCFVEEK